MRGRSQYIICYYCGRRVPRDKGVLIQLHGFSYYDDKLGIKYRGPSQLVYICPSCARYRGKRDIRPRKGRPKRR